MASFKYKPDKLKFISNVNTLDESHKKKTNDFLSKRLLLPQKESDLKNLKIKYQKITNNIANSSDPLLISKRANIKNDIEKLQKEINLIKSGKEELDYYSKTIDIVMDYYNILDNNNNDVYDEDLHSPNNSDNSQKLDNFSPIINPNISENINNDILEQLNKESQKFRKEKKVSRARNQSISNNSENILNFFTDNIDKNFSEKQEEEKNNLIVSNRASLFEDYLMVLDREYASKKIKPNPKKMCQNCQVEQQLIRDDGIYVCTQCGLTENIIIESEIPSHKENTNEKRHSAYDRRNHLSEWLNQFQGKESTDIPSDIFMAIDKELQKIKINKNNLSNMPYRKARQLIREILKKIRETDYYEHVPFIISRITGKPPPTISRDVEETIKKMFKEAQVPFNKYRPSDRKNFVNYSYALHKMFEILNMDEVADCFPLLKDRKKLQKLDQIWKKICEDLGWVFIPSI